VTPTVINDMALADIAAVIKVDRVCYPDPFDEAAWLREFEAPNRCHLVAMIGGEIVGHAGSLQVVDETHVATVAVAAAHEGAGIATRLVAELLRRGVGSGALAATLEVRVSSMRAQRLYSRLGFVPAGVRSNYYSNPTEDALIMWLYDLQSRSAQDRLGRVVAELDLSSSRGSR